MPVGFSEGFLSVDSAPCGNARSTIESTWATVASSLWMDGPSQRLAQRDRDCKQLADSARAEGDLNESERELLVKIYQAIVEGNAGALERALRPPHWNHESAAKIARTINDRLRSNSPNREPSAGEGFRMLYWIETIDNKITDLTIVSPVSNQLLQKYGTNAHLPVKELHVTISQDGVRARLVESNRNAGNKVDRQIRASDAFTEITSNLRR